MSGCRDEGLQPAAALGEGQGAQVLAIGGEQVVGADVHGIVGHELGRDDAAIQTLLQHAERLHQPVAHHQQLAVQREALAGQGGEHVAEIGKRARDVLAGAREEPHHGRALDVDAAHGLDADAVPLPFRDMGLRADALRILLLQRMRQHGRREGRGVDRLGTLAVALDPGEQLDVGRGEPVPDLLDLVGGAAAQLGHRRLGEACGDADAQRAGDQLQQRPAAGLVEPVEPAGQERGQAELADGGKAEDHGGERGGLMILIVRRRRRPQQRHRFREIADVIVGEVEQVGIDTRGDQRPDQVGLGMLERQHAGQRRQGPAPLRVRRRAEKLDHQPQLVVAGGLVSEAIKQEGEAVHGGGKIGWVPAHAKHCVVADGAKRRSGTGAPRRIPKGRGPPVRARLGVAK